MNSDFIRDVFNAANREIVGRIRLQKIFFLLDQMGFKSNFRFSYHHYGPYSEELSHSIFYAEIVEGYLQEEIRSSSSGVSFSVFRLAPESGNAPPPSNKNFIRMTRAIDLMKSSTSVVIELAATIRWLVVAEKVSDWQTELRHRKPSKASESNVKSALDLLEKLELGV